MARRPFAALGTLPTPHGLVIVRKVHERRKNTWILALEGPHAALRLLLPAWQPRSDATRTQITPPKPINRITDIMAFYQAQMPVWLDRLRAPAIASSVAVMPQPIPATYRSIGDLVGQVQTEAAMAVRRSSLVTYRHQWGTLLRHLGSDTPILALTRTRLTALMGELVAVYAPTTVLHLRTALHLLLRRAVEDGVLAADPLAHIARQKAVCRHRSYWDREQRDRLVAATVDDPDLHLVIVLGVFAGLRKAEILALTWADIDLPGRRVHVRSSATFTTKSGKSRTIPMGDDLYRLLSPLRHAIGHVVAPQRAGTGRYRWNFTKAFRSACTRAAIPVGSPHLLRHCFASIAAQEGVALFKLAEWLGHSAAKTTELYAHLAPGFDADINRLGGGPRGLAVG
jgi:integrase